MKVIRKSVFETNSSSMHSLSISGAEKLCSPNFLNGYFGEFGWGYELLSSPEDRLSYLLVALAILSGASDSEVSFEKRKGILFEYEKFKWVDDIVKDQTGKHILIDWESIEGGYYSFGYIDHQSIEHPSLIPDVLLDFWSEDKDVFCKNMTDFIFNDKYSIIIDNDNH